VLRRASRTPGPGDSYAAGRALMPVLGHLDVKKHGSSRHVPPPFRHLPLVSTLRNPFDRYVSTYEFGWWKKEDRWRPTWLAGMKSEFPQYPDLSFEEFVEMSKYLDRFSVCDRPAAPTVGLQTRELIHFFCQNSADVVLQIAQASDEVAAKLLRDDMFPVHFLRTNDLNASLVEYLESVGIPAERLEPIRKSGKVFPPDGGRSEAQRWESYYTPELKDVVRQRDRLVFELFPEFDE
jgi:hypothetical protein